MSLPTRMRAAYITAHGPALPGARRRQPGLYLLLPASLVALVSGVLNAWHFLLPPPEDRPARRPGR